MSRGSEQGINKENKKLTLIMFLPTDLQACLPGSAFLLIGIQL